MYRKMFLSVAVVAAFLLMGISASTAEAGGCYRGNPYGGFQGGGFYYPPQRSVRYYGSPYGYRSPRLYRSYYGGGYPAYYGGYRSGVSLSFGF